MTMRKLLFSATLFIFILSFTGSLLIGIHNFQATLQNTIQTQTENAANTLAFSLSEPVQQNLAAQQTVIDALFETGEYRAINFLDTHGNIILSRTSTAKTPTSPTWFKKLFPLNLTESTALVSQGWHQLGTVHVVPQTDLVYAQLWSNANELLLWFSILLLITIAIELVALHLLLKPLDAIKDQATDIIDHKFTLQHKLPRTKELRSVVAVMNKLSKKIHDAFAEQTSIINQLNERTHTDALTGLANRNYFNHLLDTLLSNTNQSFHGTLLLTEVKNLDELKKIKGYQVSEQMLLQIATYLKEYSVHYNDVIIARLSSNTFALVIPQTNLSQAEAIAAALVKQFTLLLSQENIAYFCTGVALYKTAQSRSEFLSVADEALHLAQVEGKNLFHICHDTAAESSHISSFKKFKELLQKNITDKSYCLFFQPVYYIDQINKTLLSVEGLFRLKNADGSFVNAGEFWDLIDRENMKVELDKLSIQYIMTLSNKLPNDAFVSINLSSNSLLDPDFIAWLESISTLHKIKIPLGFEITEDTAVKNTEAVAQFIQKFRAFGYLFILDDFGNTLHSLKYIQSLALNYVKIHGCLTANIATNLEEKFYARMLVELAHNLEIKVIAKGIETTTQQNELMRFGVDGFQGYLYAKPDLLDNILESK